MRRSFGTGMIINCQKTVIVSYNLQKRHLFAKTDKNPVVFMTFKEFILRAYFQGTSEFLKIRHEILEAEARLTNI